MKKSLAVITGCDSGIGSSLCGILLHRGYAVAAAYLDTPPVTRGDALRTFTMDLRDERDIGRFAEGVNDLCVHEHRLALLVHNAGVALGGPVEDTPLAVYREAMEINFFGLVSLTQKLIPLMLLSRGTIALIGSLAGRIALPFLSPYASSKFALEGFADSLRREMLPFGVRTVLFEPAAVATPIWNRALERETPVSERYRAWTEKFRNDFIASGNNGLAADKAALRIVRILEKKNPRARYLIAKTAIIPRLELAIPTPVMDRLILSLFNMRRL